MMAGVFGAVLIPDRRRLGRIDRKSGWWLRSGDSLGIESGMEGEKGMIWGIEDCEGCLAAEWDMTCKLAERPWPPLAAGRLDAADEEMGGVFCGRAGEWEWLPMERMDRDLE